MSQPIESILGSRDSPGERPQRWCVRWRPLAWRPPTLLRVDKLESTNRAHFGAETQAWKISIYFLPNWLQHRRVGFKLFSRTKNLLVSCPLRFRSDTALQITLFVPRNCNLSQRSRRRELVSHSTVSPGDRKLWPDYDAQCDKDCRRRRRRRQ